MANVLLKTKLKNLIMSKTKLPLEFSLNNNNVNGKKVGCSGFIRNPENNLIVYVDTEHSVYGPLSNKFMYRYAENFNDYTGSINQWANSETDLAKKIIYHLESEVHYFD